MTLNAQALLRNDELFEDVMSQYCQVMECSMCGFRKRTFSAIGMLRVLLFRGLNGKKER